MNYFLYLFSKIFGSKIANWIDNDGEANVALVIILAVIPVMLLIYFSELDQQFDQDQIKYLFIGFLGLLFYFVIFLKHYVNYILILNFIFWLIVLLFNFPNFYKTLPLKFSSALNQVSNLSDENSKNDQENIKTDQVKIICENYWTFENEFQNIRKTQKYKETNNKIDRIKIINEELKFVEKELMKDLERAKSANCQVTSNGQKMIRKNIKYLNEIRKEIEKLNMR